MSRWTLPCLLLAVVCMLFFASRTTSLPILPALRAQHTQATFNMVKDVIVKFKKTASADDKNKILDEIKKVGGTVKDTEHLESSIFPYAVVNVSPDQFTSLQGGFSGSNVVDHIEEDKEMRTQ